MVDSFERVMARDGTMLAGSPTTVTFSFPFTQPVAVQHRIVATLTDAQGMVDRKEQLFAPKNLPPSDDFTMLAYNASGNNSYRARMTAERCYELGMDSTHHLYDIRQGQYAGHTDHISTQIAPGEALLYSLLPYRVAGVSVRGPAGVALGEQASFRAAVSIAAPTERNREKNNGTQLHCFHVEVTNPAGELAKEYTQNVLAPAGSAGFSVPFALSDAEGLWRVSVNDVATGVNGELEVKLMAPLPH